MTLIAALQTPARPPPALAAVVGPGIITANVDNDAGGITTYSVAGAHYGYSLLWMMPLVALALIIVQEMSAALGVVTGKGLADLIRERMGVRLTALIIGIFLFANLANTVSEFAGVAASMEIFGVSKYLSVPIAAVVVWLLIVKANYKWVERVFLAASAIFLAYIISGVMARPPWEEVAQAFVTPSFHFDAGYVTIFVTIIGTTIAPWMQFYQQSSIVDKGLKITDYAYERIDVVVGSLFAVVVASFIMIACAATLYVNGVRIESAKDAALALGLLPARMRRSCSASDCSMPRSSRRRSCRSRLPMSCAKRSAGRRGWTTAGARRRSSSPSIPR